VVLALENVSFARYCAMLVDRAPDTRASAVAAVRMVEVRFIRSSLIETADTGRGISCARADHLECVYRAVAGE